MKTALDIYISRLLFDKNSGGECIRQVSITRHEEHFSRLKQSG